MIKLENVSKYYHSENNVSVGIRKVNLTFDMGEFVVITGASGSGKTTLLNVISGMDKYEEGTMYINGEDTGYFSESDYERYRNNYISFIFQNYNLIESYSVYENVELALTVKGQTKAERKQQVLDIITKVGLANRIRHKVTKLSGGERQRVAIARALATGAPIIVCDEITGNLDHDNGLEIIKLLKSVSEKKLVLLVTHDPNEVLPYATRLIRMYDGSVASDEVIHPVETEGEGKETSVKPLKFIELFRIALKNIFNTPKKSIFMFIILLVTAFFISLSYSLYTEQGVNNRFYMSFDSVNRYPQRVVVKKGDLTAFSEDDYQAIEDIRGVKNLIRDDLVLDQKLMLQLPENVRGDYYGYGGNVMFQIRSSEDITSPMLAAGKMPAMADEIVISSSNQTIINLEKLVGTVVKINQTIADRREFRITGVMIDELSPDTVYMQEELMAEIYPQIETLFSSVSVSQESSSIIERGHFVILPDNTLSDDTVRAKIVDIFFDKGYLETVFKDNYLYDIAYSNPYYSVEIKDKKIIAETIEVRDKNIIFVNNEYGILYVSPAVYTQLMTEKRYQLSVTINDPNSSQSIIRNLNSQNFTAFKVALNYQTGIEQVITGFFILGFSLLLMFVVYLIAYISLRNIMLSKKKDYLIMRSLGVQAKNIRLMVHMEIIMSTLISVILWIIGIIILKVYVNSRFLLVLKAMKATDMIVDIVIMLILALLLGFRYARTIVKETIVTRIVNQ
jgi:ABC-type lipoprotein export system ATPase subunit